MTRGRLVIYGSGAMREHATFHSLLASGADVWFALSGRNGLLEKQKNVVHVSRISDAISLARRLAPCRVLVLSPSETLGGIVDVFERHGIATFGTPGNQIWLESSKLKSKLFMTKYRIATPHADLFPTIGQAHAELRKRSRKGSGGVVVKTDCYLSNASQRVFVADNNEAAEMHLAQLARHVGNDTGILLESRVSGPELSLHVLLDEERYEILPIVCDYKRRFENDAGINTGGMGAIAAAATSEQWRKEIVEKIVEPTVAALLEERIKYRGILYIGVIFTESGPQVLEYNVRSGSPEWVAILMLLESSADGLFEWSRGERPGSGLGWKSGYSLVSVLTTRDYPANDGRVATPVYIPSFSSEISIFGESIAWDGSRWLAKSGRVLCIAASGPDMAKLADRVEAAACNGIEFEGKHYRRDIGRDYRVNFLQSAE